MGLVTAAVRGDQSRWNLVLEPGTGDLNPSSPRPTDDRCRTAPGFGMKPFRLRG